VPEPGSKKYDTRRARLRKDAEWAGAGKDASEEANESLRQDPEWRSRGPRTERGRGPNGERRDLAGWSRRHVRAIAEAAHRYGIGLDHEPAGAASPAELKESSPQILISPLERPAALSDPPQGPRP
jgi:hypothetical protein